MRKGGKGDPARSAVQPSDSMLWEQVRGDFEKRQDHPENVDPATIIRVLRARYQGLNGRQVAALPGTVPEDRIDKWLVLYPRFREAWRSANT